jgi:histidinol-phosphate aminotransferase
MNYYVNPNIASITRVPIEQGRRGYIRLDMNENPDGLPKAFFDSVMKEVTPEFLSIYPEDGEFIKTYAKYLGLSSENILPTDGTTNAIQLLIQTFGEAGKDLVTVTPSFGMYFVNGSLVGMKNRFVQYEKDLTFKTENILNAINSNTGIIVLVNPNMPVGNVYSQEDIRTIVTKAKENHVFVIIDEAYFYFYEQTSLDLIREFDNVAILRTFSKFLSIPALRLGAIVSNPSVIHFVYNLESHFSVNAVALLFGQRILENKDKLFPILEKNAFDGRKLLVDTLAKQKYEMLPANGCYVAVKPKHASVQTVFAELKKRKILVLAGTGALSNYIRVTTAAPKYMKIFLKEFLDIDR